MKLTSKDKTVDVMEMPLCFSRSIQSDVALRCEALDLYIMMVDTCIHTSHQYQASRHLRHPPAYLTAPASLIAPPYSNSFSVSVVLPESGCEMMAKLRLSNTFDWVDCTDLVLLSPSSDDNCGASNVSIEARRLLPAHNDVFLTLLGTIKACVNSMMTTATSSKSLNRSIDLSVCSINQKTI